MRRLLLANALLQSALQDALNPPKRKRGPKPKPKAIKTARASGRPPNWSPQMYAALERLQGELKAAGKRHSCAATVSAFVDRAGLRPKYRTRDARQRFDREVNNLVSRFREHVAKKPE